MKTIRWYKPEAHFGHTALDEAFDRFFGSGQLAEGSSAAAWAPRVDVHENAESFLVTAEVPGLAKEDIAVSLHEGVLTISGERKEEKTEGTDSHVTERYVGKFERSLSLPSEVVTGKVEATYKDGVLTVTLPKAEAAKPRRIELN